uniref:Uncharacterized protein n=1 Tax=Sphaerodactylus townsendi TaxID=933632 RepID=A0ACB8EGU4_9SAUR
MLLEVLQLKRDLGAQEKARASQGSINGTQVKTILENPPSENCQTLRRLLCVNSSSVATLLALRLRKSVASVFVSFGFHRSNPDRLPMKTEGPIYHWIGLRKPQEDRWEWANGQIFNNTLFDIVEGGDCAYLNDVKVMSSWCKTKKNWICSKPDTYMPQRKLSEERREAGP